MSEGMWDFINFLVMFAIVLFASYKSYSTGYDEGYKEGKKEKNK